ncbi:MAG: hypothetical protein AAB434_11855, partial [Planctomycetota bacterium]
WFDMASGLVPAGIGIQEASRFFAFRLLGIPEWEAKGLTYAILLRVEQLTYTTLGFVCYGNEVRKLDVARVADAKLDELAAPRLARVLAPGAPAEGGPAEAEGHTPP